jgi:hypothetical protein
MTEGCHDILYFDELYFDELYLTTADFAHKDIVYVRGAL